MGHLAQIQLESLQYNTSESSEVFSRVVNIEALCTQGNYPLLFELGPGIVSQHVASLVKYNGKKKNPKKQPTRNKLETRKIRVLKGGECEENKHSGVRSSDGVNQYHLLRGYANLHPVMLWPMIIRKVCC